MANDATRVSLVPWPTITNMGREMRRDGNTLGLARHQNQGSTCMEDGYEARVNSFVIKQTPQGVQRSFRMTMRSLALADEVWHGICKRWCLSTVISTESEPKIRITGEMGRRQGMSNHCLNLILMIGTLVKNNKTEQLGLCCISRWTNIWSCCNQRRGAEGSFCQWLVCGSGRKRIMGGSITEQEGFDV